MVGKRAPLHERFLAKFVIGPDGECWNWQAGTNGVGYGMLWDPDRRRRSLAHRLSFEYFVGPIHRGALIRHTCDNPACVNPRHLLPGTHKDNSMDKVVRGRASTLLRAGDVIALLNDYVSGMSRADMAKKYAVSLLSLDDYTSGRAWSHLHGNHGCPSLAELEAAKRVSPLTEDIVREIWRLHFLKMPVADIASQVGQPFHPVSNVVEGKTWRHLPGAPPIEELKQGGVRRGYNQFSKGGDTRSAHPKTKVLSSEIPAILARLAAGETLAEVGRTYGVQKSAIHRIKKQHS